MVTVPIMNKRVLLEVQFVWRLNHDIVMFKRFIFASICMDILRRNDWNPVVSKVFRIR